MYRDFFNLDSNPFNLTPDAGSFYRSRSGDETLMILKYAIETRAGFVVISGEVGTGKTTLTRYFLNNLSTDVSSALIFNPSLTTLQLLKAINKDFGLNAKARSKEGLVSELNEFLFKVLNQGGNAVIVIDEAQNLSHECLEELRMLSNLETEKEKLIQIILIGQPELDEILQDRSLRQLNQRISLRCRLHPLNENELSRYVETKLNNASSKASVIFSRGGLKELYHLTKGVPRLINKICEKALTVAFLNEKKCINAKMIKQAARELDHIPEINNQKVVQEKRYGNNIKPILAGMAVLIISLSFLPFKQALIQQKKTIQEGAGSQQSIWFDNSSNLYKTSDKANSLSVSILNIAKEFSTGDNDFDYKFNKLNILKKKDILEILKSNGMIMGNVNTSVETLLQIESSNIALIYPFDIMKSRYVVLKRTGYENFTITDPIYGIKPLSVDELKDIWQGDTVLIWKSIADLNKDDYGDGLSIRALKIIQSVLSEIDFYHGQIDGLMGTQTIKAIEKFQKSRTIENEYGRFGPETYYWLSQSFYKQ